jgi:hypothetical protein
MTKCGTRPSLMAPTNHEIVANSNKTGMAECRACLYSCPPLLSFSARRTSQGIEPDANLAAKTPSHAVDNIGAFDRRLSSIGELQAVCASRQAL